MTLKTMVFLTAVLSVSLENHVFGSPVFMPPSESIFHLKDAPPCTNDWWLADCSMQRINAKITANWSPEPDFMVGLMWWGLVKEPFQYLARQDAADKVPKILEALYRSGDSPNVTNALHAALLAPTNHYREATFRAYVMAAPVPMTSLAKTVVEHFPPATREQWYRSAAADAWRPATFWRREPGRTRESLRLAHFLHTAKTVETNRACLKAIGDTADPEREGDQP